MLIAISQSNSALSTTHFAVIEVNGSYPKEGVEGRRIVEVSSTMNPAAEERQSRCVQTPHMDR